MMLSQMEKHMEAFRGILPEVALPLSVSQMQDEEPRNKRQQPVSKVIKLNQLKTVLKNLSLLRLLKNSKPRIIELHKLAKRCWNSLLSVPTILISSGNIAVCDGVDQNIGEPQEARCSKKKLESKKLESRGKSKESRPKVGVGKRNEPQQSRAAVLERDQVESETPRTPRGHGLTASSGTQGRQLPTECPRLIFLKTHQQRTASGDMEQVEAAGRWIWFEGLPTRIHLPGPRVMCRPSTLRLVKRCCTRFCSASLELPMYHPYRV
ncbi:PREDICTED: TP53-target gene 5 protein isoform X1 [Hipposideros armiger]|uniref:TP53-target gene 5 protein isoform X1 n=1 Tax=Hipposideros armiger TaxID=186990 RepID=A0A8B7QXQ4_HIPAR|nr:PREDICTED: TP53-target gene 5 protein isoform X1 [Hipposideros armiger]XP_019492568.1 PREDICTED: TP53-target gene 5 protein isoform X1 [Hipposideros armiger]